MLENALQDMFCGHVSFSCCVASFELSRNLKFNRYIYLTSHLTALLYLNTLIIIAGDFICIDWQRTVKLAINIYISTTVLYEDNIVFVRSFLSLDRFQFLKCKCVKRMRVCRCECDFRGEWVHQKGVSYTLINVALFSLKQV